MISYLKHEQELLNSHSRRQIFIINRCSRAGESHTAVKHESSIKTHLSIVCIWGLRGGSVWIQAEFFDSCCHQFPKWFCCPDPLWPTYCYISSCVNTLPSEQMSTLSSCLLCSNKISIFHKQKDIRFSHLIFQAPNDGISNFR